VGLPDMGLLDVGLHIILDILKPVINTSGGHSSRAIGLIQSTLF
jgi:hypothetical protein